MTKAIKIALVVLCAGALLAGIGAGVAFGEYSSLDYEKYELPEAGDRKTVEKTFEIPEGGEVRITSPWENPPALIEDESVAEGTVTVSASALGLADEVFVEQRIETAPYGSSDDPESWTKRLCITAYPTDRDAGFSQFMQCKDVYLEGLKRGVVYDIPSVYDDFSVEIRVNPADRARVSSY